MFIYYRHLQPSGYSFGPVEPIDYENAIAHVPRPQLVPQRANGDQLVLLLYSNCFIYEE